MTTPLAFDRLVHSDWSVTPPKRWTAVATRSRGTWLIDRLTNTPASDEFVGDLFDPARKTLAGFDFPIGLPAVYANKAKLDFRDLLARPTSASARRFFTPVETLSDISLAQPFYRKHPKGGRHADLWKRLGCAGFDDLLRECDRKTKSRNRAESIFWTVGARQVGKAALAGWREILVPALARQARLWPFDGLLSALDSNVLTIAETYPAEAYRHVGIGRAVGKRSREGRRAGCRIMLEWACRHRVDFAPKIEQSMLDGFGDGGEGEDPFDAVAGLCGMIEVADGRRAAAPDLAALRNGEGWILGQIDVASR